MKLKPVLRAGVLQRNDKLIAPVPGVVFLERHEHRLEVRAATVSALQVFGPHIQPSDLRSQSLQKSVNPLSAIDRRQILIKKSLGRTFGIPALGARGENPVGAAGRFHPATADTFWNVRTPRA